MEIDDETSKKEEVTYNSKTKIKYINNRGFQTYNLNADIWDNSIYSNTFFQLSKTCSTLKFQS
ncbi:MAG: hypothetical protein ACI90V_010739 [Bacillariaceae sp.]|jgi:hypothetical protein